MICRYPIAGGWLARRPGGSIAFAQDGKGITSTISGFHPRLGLLQGLYSHVQARIHAVVRRRYFTRLDREGATSRVAVFGATGTIGNALPANSPAGTMSWPSTTASPWKATA